MYELNFPIINVKFKIAKLVNGPASAMIAFFMFNAFAFFTFVLYSSFSTLKLICSPTGESFNSSGLNYTCN